MFGEQKRHKIWRIDTHEDVERTNLVEVREEQLGELELMKPFGCLLLCERTLPLLVSFVL